MSLGKFSERDHRAIRRWRERPAAQQIGRALVALGRSQRADESGLPGRVRCGRCGATFSEGEALAFTQHDCTNQGGRS
jgi:hypothetical protein